MKFLFFLALLCASLASFSQRITGCGYAFQTFAITAGVARAQTTIATTPNAVMAINPQVYQQANGSWCYSFYLVTLPPPEPLPSPLPKSSRTPLVFNYSGDYLAHSIINYATRLRKRQV